MDQMLLIHISDLHMSDSLESSVLNNNGGQQGHDPQLCRLLASRISQVASAFGVTYQDVRWVVSGDLTRTGDDREFNTVRNFIQLTPLRDRLGRPLNPTLGIAPESYLDVPGNHDHWNGWDESGLFSKAVTNPPPACNSKLFPGTFQPTVWDNLSTPWISSTGSFRLELFGVDSNSGLANSQANRLAVGKISDAEFAALEDALRLSNDREKSDNAQCVRTIVCHHAFTQKPQSGMWQARPLDQNHVDRLISLAAKYRVTAVLTGHTHTEAYRMVPVTVVKYGETTFRNCSVYEIRSPTTLQGLAKSQVHGFWVHHLFRAPDSVSVIWRPRLYKFAAGRLHSKAFADIMLF